MKITILECEYSGNVKHKKRDWELEITKEMVRELMQLFDEADEEIIKIQQEKQKKGHPQYAI